MALRFAEPLEVCREDAEAFFGRVGLLLVLIVKRALTGAFVGEIEQRLGELRPGERVAIVHLQPKGTHVPVAVREALARALASHASAIAGYLTVHEGAIPSKGGAPSARSSYPWAAATSVDAGAVWLARLVASAGDEGSNVSRIVHAVELARSRAASLDRAREAAAKAG